MNFKEIENTFAEDKDLFVEKFGYFLMKVSRKDLPKLVEMALKLQNEVINKKIENNIHFLLRKVKIGELGKLLDILFRNPNYYKIIAENFKELSTYFAPNNIEDVINAFLKVNINSKIVSENLETFLENCKTKVQAQRIINSVKHIPKCLSKINQYQISILNLGDFEFLEALNIGTMMKIINSNHLDELKSIFTKYSNGNISNIHFLGSGFTSTAFSVDDKVIKIGKERIKFNAQFSKYLLQPYLRKEVSDIEGNVIFTVEVQDKCSTTDIDTEKAQEFLDHINSKSNKFVWLDPSLENLFVLQKPNTRKLQPSEDGFCYDGVDDYEPVGEKGDFVIGDTDFIYSPKEYNEKMNSYKTPMHKKTFSLILPIYNMEKYLNNCLNSILNQTCNDYEVIIINDGSIDNSLEIAKDYANSDSRFRVFTFENAGLSEARNRGISLAEGEYIILIDPDDSIEPELLEKLKPYVNNGIETIRYGAVVKNEGRQKDNYRFNRPYYPDITTGIEALERWNNDKRYATAWLYCIKKDVYNRCDFKFPNNVKIYEDLASIPKLIANSKSVSMLDYIGYNYIQHENTITNGKGDKKLLYNLKGFIIAYDFIKDELTKYFSIYPYDEQVENNLLDGFFTRLENKFKNTNCYKKDIFANNLFMRNRKCKLDYNPQKYFRDARNGINQNSFYTPEEEPISFKCGNTSITKLGDYTYNSDGFIDKVGLYRVEKEGQYNFMDSFLCMSNINFEELKTNELYKKMLFDYLLSYTNIFLAESLNGSYIGDIKYDNNKTLSINFDENITKFARNLRSCVKKIPSNNIER